jgi:hypothetical protein
VASRMVASRCSEAPAILPLPSSVVVGYFPQFLWMVRLLCTGGLRGFGEKSRHVNARLAVAGLLGGSTLAFVVSACIWLASDPCSDCAPWQDYSSNTAHIIATGGLWTT